MSQMDDLVWGLAKSRLSIDFLAEYGQDPEDINMLVRELRGRRCEGIQEKFKDIGPGSKDSHRKLEATLSEFRFAEHFAKKYCVKFVNDSDDTYGPSPPDLALSASGEVVALVEVAMLSDGYIGKRLEDELQKIGHRKEYRIHISITGRSARSALKWWERQEQDRLIDQCKKSVNDAIRSISAGAGKVATCVVEDIVIKVWSKTLGTAGYSDAPEGYAIEVDTAAWRTHVLGILIEKANKQLAFHEGWSAVPYVVALHNKDSFFDETDLRDLLYESNLPIGDVFTKAVSKGWKTLVNREYPKLRGECIATIPGAYLDVVRSLGGVYLMSHSGRVRFFPNPFRLAERCLCEGDSNSPSC